MKHLFKWQYSNHQFIKSLTFMACQKACTKIQACQLFWCEVYC